MSLKKDQEIAALNALRAAIPFGGTVYGTLIDSAYSTAFVRIWTIDAGGRAVLVSPQHLVAIGFLLLAGRGGNQSLGLSSLRRRSGSERPSHLNPRSESAHPRYFGIDTNAYPLAPNDTALDHDRLWSDQAEATAGSGLLSEAGKHFDT